MAWFAGMMGLGMTMGVAQLGPRVVAAEMGPDVVRTDAELGPVLVVWTTAVVRHARVAWSVVEVKAGVEWSVVEVGAAMAGLLLVGDETSGLSDIMASTSTTKISGGNGCFVTCASTNASSGKMLWLIGQMPVDLKPARIFEGVAALVHASEANSGSK